LFERFDPAEVAAALLALQRETGSAMRDAVIAGPSEGARVKVFVGLGKKDRASAKDLVGALIREAGVPKDDIGRIDVRETFSLVAHLVLVASFLAYGGWQFFQRLGTVELATDAHGTCPDCGAEQALDLAARWRAPQPVTCRQCHRGLQLVLPSP